MTTKEPVAWILDCPPECDEFLNHDERSTIIFDREQLSWEEYDGWKITPLFTHPAHDDTALLRLALEALDDSVGLVVNDALQAEELYGRYPTRQARVAGMKKIADDHQAAITALRERLGEKV